MANVERVTVTLSDGTVFVNEVSFPPGHDKNPLSDEQLSVKFHGLADPALGNDRAEALLNRLSQIEVDERPHESIAWLDL